LGWCCERVVGREQEALLLHGYLGQVYIIT
jgi:hypothetical protein